MTKRSMTFVVVTAVAIAVAVVIVRNATPRCDNARLGHHIERIEQLAKQSSTMDEARSLAIRTLLQACEGEPAWVGDDLEWEFRKGAPDRTTSGRDRWWIESFLVCDFDGMSVLGFDGNQRGVDQCGFERFAVVYPDELERLDMLDLDDTSFGFWAAGAMFERHGADPSLLRRYYRVLLLGLDVANTSVDLVVRYMRIHDARNDRILEPDSDELEQYIEEIAGQPDIVIEADVCAERLAWSRPAWDQEHRELWMLERRLDFGLPVRAPVSIVDRIPPESQILQLDIWGWRWGDGELHLYEHLDDEPPQEQRHAGTSLVVVLHADVSAERFIPILDALSREQSGRTEVSVAFEWMLPRSAPASADAEQ